MKKNTICVSVSGSTGTGKTTIIMAISELLCNHGFEVKLENIDSQLEEKLDNLDNIGIKTEVVISEINVGREGV